MLKRRKRKLGQRMAPDLNAAPRVADYLSVAGLSGNKCWFRKPGLIQQLLREKFNSVVWRPIRSVRCLQTSL
jgi:hypothetical protein